MKTVEVRLGDLVIFQRGFDITKKEQSDGCIPVISSGGISSYHNASKVEGPGIIIGRKGTLGTVFYNEDDFWPHDTTLWVKDFKGNDPLFIYYLLKTLRLERFDAGAANPTLNRNHIHSLKISVPSVEGRGLIGRFLSAYDELIVENTKRINLLEQMAEEIYKEWFVRLRFPGSETMQIQNDVPENWDRRPLGEVYETSSGGTPSRRVPEYYGEGYQWAKTRELKDSFVLETDETITELGLKKSSAKLFPANTVLIAMYGATIGRLGILSEPAATNQACAALLPKKIGLGRAFIYLLLKENRLDLVSLGQGAAQQNISQDVIKKFPILYPPKYVAEQFSEIVEPMFDLILHLVRKNNLLKQTRDLLLPRLISGKLEVEHLLDGQ